MKRIFTAVILLSLCFSLVSCGMARELKRAISGELIEPVKGFSNGDEDGTLVYNGNKYVIIKETNGDCEIELTSEDVLLGRASNFPFFTDTYYYASHDDSPRFIIGHISGAFGTFVFLREDLYNGGIVYALEDGSFEFEFSSAFTETDEINYKKYVSKKKYTRAETVRFYVKDTPEIKSLKNIYLINGVWYSIDKGAKNAYKLFDDLVKNLPF